MHKCSQIFHKLVMCSQLYIPHVYPMLKNNNFKLHKCLRTLDSYYPVLLPWILVSLSHCEVKSMLGTKDLTGLGNSRAAQDKPGTAKL